MTEGDPSNLSIDSTTVVLNFSGLSEIMLIVFAFIFYIQFYFIKLMKIIIIMIIVLFVNKIYRTQKKYKIPECDADIIFAPAGIKAPYNFGICHYLKNHFDITDKKMVGFSSGSLINLLMTMDKENTSDFLKILMKNKLNNDIKAYLKKTVHTIGTQFTEKDFNLNLLNVGVSHADGLYIYNNFSNLKDALECCTSSSFIPFITYKDLLYFYKYKLSLDGGVFYNAYKSKKNDVLIINHYMFKRYKKTNVSNLNMFISKNINVYQMYLTGYNDARNNHNYFLKYLKPL